jgi:histidyl-tRNA synthetase
MAMVRYQPPRGTRDFLPAEMAHRNHVERVVRASFESFGYQQIQTPIFEQYELLAARSGDEIKESMFTFASDAGRYALRPELTSPVCRLMASNAFAGLVPPHKLYYFGPCFRYCRPQAGRHREFYQAGIELMGSGDPLADAEVIALAATALTELGITDYSMRIGDVGVFRDLLGQYLPADERGDEWQSRIIGDIDKIMHLREKCRLFASGELSADDRDYVGRLSNALHKLQEEAGYRGEFAIAADQPPGAAELPLAADATYRASWVHHGILTAEQADLVIRVSRIRGAADTALPAARELLAGTAALRPVADLANVCEWLPALGVSGIEVVLGMARNLDFYTGTVFELDAPLLGAQRQICGGGRYDRLVGEFGGPAMPATGFAFGFDRLVEAFRKQNEREDRSINDSAVDVLVIGPREQRREAVALAQRLRAGRLKLRADTDLMGGDLAAQREYAAKLSASSRVSPIVVELAPQNQCRLWSMPDSPETTVAVSRLEEELGLRLKKGTA